MNAYNWILTLVNLIIKLPIKITLTHLFIQDKLTNHYKCASLPLECIFES